MWRIIALVLAAISAFADAQLPSRAWMTGGLSYLPSQYAASPDFGVFSIGNNNDSIILNAVDGTIRRVEANGFAIPISNLHYIRSNNRSVHLTKIIDGQDVHTFELKGQPYFAHGRVYILTTEAYTGKKDLHEYQLNSGLWVKGFKWSIPIHDFLSVDVKGRWFAVSKRNHWTQIYSLTNPVNQPEVVLLQPQIEGPLIFSPDGSKFAYRDYDPLNKVMTARIGSVGGMWNVSQSLPLGYLTAIPNKQLFSWDPGSQALWCVHQIGTSRFPRRIALAGDAYDFPIGLGQSGSTIFVDGIPTKTGNFFGAVSATDLFGSYDKTGTATFENRKLSSVAIAVATSPDDRVIYLLSRNRLIALGAASGRFLMSRDFDDSAQGMALAAGKLVINFPDKRRWYNAADLSVLRVELRKTTSADLVASAPATKDHPSLVATDDEGVVKIIRVTDYTLAKQIPTSSTVVAMSFSGDGSRFVLLRFGSGVHTLSVYRTADWSVEAQWTFEARLEGVAINRLGDKLGVLVDGKVSVYWRNPSWDLAPRQTSPFQGGDPRTIAFSPDGRAIAVGGLSRIDVFRTVDLRLMSQLEGESGATRVLHFTPYSQTIVRSGGMLANLVNSDPTIAALFNPLRVPAAWTLQPLQPVMKAGQKAKVILKLSGVAINDSTVVNLSATPATALTMPSQIQIPKGQSSVQFEVTAKSVSMPTVVRLNAVYTRFAEATLRVNP